MPWKFRQVVNELKARHGVNKLRARMGVNKLRALPGVNKLRMHGWVLISYKMHGRVFKLS